MQSASTHHRHIYSCPVRQLRPYDLLKAILLLSTCGIQTVWANADDVDDSNTKTEAGAVLTAMGLSSTLLAASLILFEGLRRSSYCRALYRPSMIKESEPNGEERWRDWNSFLGWMRLPHRHGRNADTLQDDLETVGLEALVLNRYMHFGVNITRVGAIAGAFMCPIYTYLGSGHEESWVMKASTRNIDLDTTDKQDWFFVGVAVISSIFACNTMFSIVKEYNWFLVAWRTALDLRSYSEDNSASDAAVMYGRALLLEDIPSALGPSTHNGELLLPFFQRLFPAVNGYPRVVSANSYTKEKFEWTEAHRRFIRFNQIRKTFQECQAKLPKPAALCLKACNGLFCGKCCSCLSDEAKRRVLKKLEQHTEAIEQGIDHVSEPTQNVPIRRAPSTNISVNIESPAFPDDPTFSDVDFDDEVKEVQVMEKDEMSAVSSANVIKLDSIHSLDSVSLPESFPPPPPPMLKREVTRANLWRAPTGDVQLLPKAEADLDRIVNNMAAQQEDALEQRGFWLCRCQQLQRLYSIFRLLAQHVNYLMCCTTVPRRTTTGFVVFDSWVAKVVCNEVLVTESDESKTIGKIPDPPMKTFAMPLRNEIIWRNVTEDPEQIRVRHICVWLVSSFVVLLWYGIVTISATFSTDLLLGSSYGKGDVDDVGTENAWRAFSREYIPVVVVIILLNLVPTIFRQVAVRYIGFKTDTEVDVFVAKNYSSFQFANVYISIFATSIYGAVQQIVDNPWSTHEILGNTLPLGAEYLLLTVIIRVGVMANYLVQFDRILRRTFCCQGGRANVVERADVIDALPDSTLEDFGEVKRAPLWRWPDNKSMSVLEAGDSNKSKKVAQQMHEHDSNSGAPNPGVVPSQYDEATRTPEPASVPPSDAPAQVTQTSEDVEEAKNASDIQDAALAAASSGEEGTEGSEAESEEAPSSSKVVRVCRATCVFVGRWCSWMALVAKRILKVIFCATTRHVCCIASTALKLVTGNEGDDDALETKGLKRKAPPPLFADKAIKYYVIFPEVQIVLVIYFLLWVICPIVSVVAFAYFLMAREIFGFMTRYWREDLGWSVGADVEVQVPGDGDIRRPAKIIRVVYDGTFDVQYNDDAEEFGVDMERIVARNKSGAGIASGSVWFFSVYSRTSGCLLCAQALGALYLGFKEAELAASVQTVTLFFTWLVRRSLYTGYEQRQSALTLVQAANRDHATRKERNRLEKEGLAAYQEALRVPSSEIVKEFSQPGYKLYEQIQKIKRQSTTDAHGTGKKEQQGGSGEEEEKKVGGRPSSSLEGESNL